MFLTEFPLLSLSIRNRAASDLGRIHAADLFLACACAAGDAAALDALERQFLAPLPALVARRGIALHDAEEVVQALRERLLVGKDGRCPAILDYDGRGAIGAWVRVAAIRSASNLRRDEQNRKALASDAAVELPVGDPALAIIKRRFAAEFQSALVEAFAALDPTDRTVLRLQFKDGLNLDAIARVLGLSRATAGRRLLAARQRVREEVMKRLGQRTSATPAELESILGLVQSALDVSLGALDVA